MTEQWQDIEAIKQLKARYFRLMDQKNWAELRGQFTDDFSGLYRGPHPDIVFADAEQFVTQNSSVLQQAITVHHGHMPEITLTGDDTAEGIWAMTDLVVMEEQKFRGYGHYHDQYRREQGQWRISRTELSRLHIETLE